MSVHVPKDMLSNYLKTGVKMTSETEYHRNFSLEKAYEFLRSKNLESVAEEIQVSRDQFMSYSSTLRRAKVIRVLNNKGLLDEFVEKYWPSGKTKSGQTRIQFWLRLYDRFKSSEGQDEDENVENEDTEDADSTSEKQFAYERDLHNYLVNNLVKIERGLRLYQGNDGTSGNEFPVDENGRRIDILAIDAKGIPVVIELKVSRGHERTIGQALYYAEMVKKLLGINSVRIVIVASEISKELELATASLPNVELFQYKISMELSKVLNRSGSVS
jgi:Endonuclease NucS